MNSYTYIAELEEFKSEHKNYKVFNNEDNLRLIKLYKETGDIKYKNDMILGNIRLVVSVILKRNREDLIRYNIDIRDLISIGIIGLSKGIEKFDISRSSCVTSVITNYIIQNIGVKIIKYRNIINCPLWLENKKYNFKKHIRQFMLENNKSPSVDDLINIVNIDIKHIIKYYEIYYTENFKSLDLDREDENGDLLNILEDKILDEKQPIKYLEIENGIIFDKILNYLTDKQKIILQKLIDLSHGLYKNQDEIAKEMGVPRRNISAMFKLIVKKVKNLVDNKEIENIFRL
jgi:RNA polymerase primary sigma factor